MLDNRINTFLDLCKTMNFTRTAENLFITQPAVTQHIRYLENEYGVKLFAFTGKVLSLTHEGEILYRYALSARSNAINLKNSLINIKETQSVISFGATKTIGEFIMPSFLSTYVKSQPNTSVHLVVDNTHNLIQQIDDGSLDFALIEGFFDTTSYEYMPFENARFLCACSGKSKLADKERSFTELLNEKLLLRECGSGTRELTEMILKENSLSISKFNGKIEVNSFSVIHQMLCDNVGVSFVYDAVIKSSLENGNIKKVKLKNFSRFHEFNIVYLPNKSFETCVLGFFDQLCELSS